MTGEDPPQVEDTSSPMDRSCLSNPNEVVVTHLDWHVRVDFANKTLSGTATYSFDRLKKYSSSTSRVVSLKLDTNHLKIDAVTLEDGTPTPFQLDPVIANKPHLGQALQIPLPLDCNKVSILYETTSHCSALQWLPPSQTAGKEHPYLFTQCQAIHARSLVPCQDCPGVKFTYSSQVTVDAWATCVMSALATGETTNGVHKTFSFQQDVPISSYLLALAVGDLERQELSPRVAVWSEPSLVKAAAYEFAQTEDFLRIAEELAGIKYAWGRYDLLCLPPSFPYGGMENPCLTFVTPTLLAGDRSLADVVAHEIAHSWTGNLVTNATWEHFWLNEGWTTWFQRKIMTRILKNDKFLDFDALGGYKHLKDSVALLPDDFTRLVPVLQDLDPDDCFSSVPYEKGFNLLFALEQRVGTPAFEAFFQAYLQEFASKTVTSEEFRSFFTRHFQGTHEESMADFDWEEWFHQPGMPPETPNFDRTLSEASEKLAETWLAVDRHGRMLPSTDLSSWSSNQVTCFLETLESLTETSSPLQISTLAAMNEQYKMATSRNSEILFRYSQLAIAAGDESILDVVVQFITTQGRMKFVRPLYRSLFQSRMGRQLAVTTFLAHKDFYHPICAKMVAQDLCVSERQLEKKRRLKFLGGAAALGAAVALFVVFRKRR